MNPGALAPHPVVLLTVVLVKSFSLLVCVHKAVETDIV